MTTFQQLTCPNCGASFSLDAIRTDVARCEHCGTTFRLEGASAGDSTKSKLLLQADFGQQVLNGWQLDTDDKQFEYHKEHDPELWVTLPATSLMRTVMSTTGVFDDFDVSLTSRFIAGKPGGMSVGLKLRRSDEGDYLVCLAGNGMYSAGWHKQVDWGGDFVNWTAHSAAHTGLGAANQLRVVMQGKQMQIYLNGVLASSLQDDRYHSGFVRVVVSPPREMSMTLAISELTLRIG